MSVATAKIFTRLLHKKRISGSSLFAKEIEKGSTENWGRDNNKLQLDKALGYVSMVYAPITHSEFWVLL